jgi:hypothetical protein
MKVRWTKADWEAFFESCTHRLITDHAHLRRLIGTEAEAWFDAIETIDLHGNKRPLIELLQSDRVPPKIARSLLADLLKRYQLTRRPGRPRIAGYRLTPQHVKMKSARAHYKKLRSKKVKPEVALKRAAEEAGVLPSELEKYRDGEIARYLRAEKRIKALRSQF